MDIDVVGDGSLPLHYDVEVPLIMHEALSALPIPAITIHVSNRKVAQGFYQSVGIEDDRLVEVLRVVDKLDKIGTDAVAVELVETVGITRAQAEAALGLATLTGTAPDQLRARVLAALDGAEPSALLLAGLDELESLLRVAARRRPGAIVADLKIARGLDYYTGTVYESFMAGHEDLGSVCSGGRYDSLASNGKRTFPGVGISVGLSRLLSRVMGAGLIEVTRAVPTAVLVAVTDEEHRAVSDAVADVLRERGIAADELDDFWVARVEVELQARGGVGGVQQFGFGADHFGGAVVRAVLLAEAAEGQVAHARHRREKDGHGEIELAEPHPEFLS